MKNNKIENWSRMKLVMEVKRMFKTINFFQNRVTLTGTLLSELIERYDIPNYELAKILEKVVK